MVSTNKQLLDVQANGEGLKEGSRPLSEDMGDAAARSPESVKDVPVYAPRYVSSE